MFLERQEREDDRLERAKAAAVAGHPQIDIKKVWPEYFATKSEFLVPSADADMSGFKWEAPSPQSYESDMAALERAMAANQSVKFREPPPAAIPAVVEPAAASEFEWL